MVGSAAVPKMRKKSDVHIWRVNSVLTLKTPSICGRYVGGRSVIYTICISTITSSALR